MVAVRSSEDPSGPFKAATANKGKKHWTKGKKQLKAAKAKKGGKHLETTSDDEDLKAAKAIKGNKHL